MNARKMACPNTVFSDNPASLRPWDGLLYRLTRNKRSETSVNTAERLLAVGEWESGLWLHALPSPSVGIMLGDTTFRLAMCLRLGTPTEAPHRSQRGESVDCLGHHGLSCSLQQKGWSHGTSLQHK
ncbi:hypothetical protein B5X24_HaOG216851 [Helicoverpa armigera]|nr:hypothetical protein B5X24_HaOG216851 [Helicoverpa armigera]